MAIAWAACNEAYCKYLPSNAKFNADACTLVITAGERNAKSKIEFVGRITEKVKTTQTDNDLGIAIKWMAFGNADGYAGPLCLVVEVDSLPKDVFYKCCIEKLNHCQEGEGIIYFCRSRAGNAALWKDFFLEYVVKNMELAAKKFDVSIGFSLLRVIQSQR